MKSEHFLSLNDVQSAEFKSRLDDGLIALGAKNVRKQYRHLWSEKNPAFGYCYVISEFLFHCLTEPTVPKVIPTAAGLHWFLQLSNGQPLDLAKDDEYDYAKGVRRPFMTQRMSKRAQLLAKSIKP